MHELMQPMTAKPRGEPCSCTSWRTVAPERRWLRTVPARQCSTGGPSTMAARGILDSYRQQQTAEQSAAEAQDGADDPPCSTDCVTEIFSAAEFDEQLARVSENVLVVVDFYRTACGSCKYIQPGFAKICKNSGEHHAPVWRASFSLHNPRSNGWQVVFLKHNIFDAYDEETDLAHRLEIRAVPQFDFYKGGQLVERFATRDKARIAKAINKHAGEGTIELSEITRSAI